MFKYDTIHVECCGTFWRSKVIVFVEKAMWDLCNVDGHLDQGMYMKNRDARMELFDESSFGTDKALLRPTLTQVCVWEVADYHFVINPNHASFLRLDWDHVLEGGAVGVGGERPTVRHPPGFEAEKVSESTYVWVFFLNHVEKTLQAQETRSSSYKQGNPVSRRFYIDVLVGTRSVCVSNSW